MVFTSLLNWIAFALLATIYWLLPPRFRLNWLASSSLLLLLFNDYLAALLALYLVLLCAVGPRFIGIGQAGRRLRLWLAVAASLLPLALLKYQELLGIDALQSAGILRLDLGSFAVPLGISYLTFKAVMYLVECSRGTLQPAGFGSLLAYIAFAPAASSGPIDPPQRLITQINTPARLDLDRLIYGFYRIAIGVIFKYVLADMLAQYSDAFSSVWLAISLKRQLLFGPYYGIMLYFDFAGYSHIAIGAAYLLGIKSMENFAAPLLRRNISEFWRSWHISLTTFLRSYIFLPCAYRWARALGPHRAAYAATVVAFLVCGAWHGDGLNYLLWGLYHGVLLSLHQAFLHNTRKNRLFKKLRRQRWLAVPAWALTFALVSVGWYPFVFTLPQLYAIITRSTVQ